MNSPGDYNTKKMKSMKGMGSYWTAGIHKQGTDEWKWQACPSEEAEDVDYTVNSCLVKHIELKVSRLSKLLSTLFYVFSA